MSTRVALAIASFVVLVVHGIVFYDQFFNHWEKHQTAYLEQARSLAKTDAEESRRWTRTSRRIEQIIVTQFGDSRVDRCTTCHMPRDDPRFQGHAEPLQTHPYSAALGDVRAMASGSAGTSSRTLAARFVTTARAADLRPSTRTAKTRTGRSRCSATSTQANWKRSSNRS